jgi:hypothetical protein
MFLCFFVYKGLRRWWKQDRKAVVPYLMAMAIFPLPYYLTHSSMDYRQPLEPMMILLVSIGLFGTAPAWEPATETDSEEDLDDEFVLA